jgi:L-lactate dehydrogenase (cytochrome)
MMKYSSFILHHSSLTVRSLSASRYVNVEDLRLGARRRLPRAVFDYIDGGADRENTLDRNARAYEDITFRPRCAVAISNYEMKTTVLGSEIAMPIILAPVGSSRMFYPRGEEVAARVAGTAGTIYILSTLSGCRLEDVKKATPGHAWYQVYLCGGREIASKTIGRARDAGFSALVVTIDTPVAGLRERDFRNGTKELLTRRPWPMLPYVGQFITRPRWLAQFLADGGLMSFPNVMLPDGPMPYADLAGTDRRQGHSHGR